MNIETIISRVCNKLPYSKDIIRQTIGVSNTYLGESLNAVQLDEISVPYLGTFFIDQTKFFRKLLRTFVTLRKLKDRLKLIEENKGKEHYTYRNTLKKYNDITVEFRKLWEYKQSKGWMFTYSTSKSKKYHGYFQESYDKKNERDKQFAV